MRILYDGKIFSEQPFGGINRYFGNVISRLPEGFAASLLLEGALRPDFPNRHNLKLHAYGKARLEDVSYRLNDYCLKLEKYIWKNITSFRVFDIAHPSYYNLVTGRRIEDYRCPVVLTVWDMIHELFPAEMDPTGEQAELKRQAIMAADVVICISENTKQDLLERYRIPENRIRVTHLASDIHAGMSHGPEPVPDRPYYVYVGSRAAHKNFDGLLKAYSKMVSVQPDVALCVVGAPLTNAEERMISELKLNNHIDYYGHVSDEHLAKIYRCSIALVYPSLYEGFGIPPLEAMLCGTAVVTSRCSSLPEVVGNAGVFFEPSSPDELAEILINLVSNSTVREDLIVKGSRQAQKFSWDITADQTVKIYRSLSQ